MKKKTKPAVRSFARFLFDLRAHYGDAFRFVVADRFPMLSFRTVEGWICGRAVPPEWSQLMIAFRFNTEGTSAETHRICDAFIDRLNARAWQQASRQARK